MANIDKAFVLSELKKYRTEKGESIFKHCGADGWIYNQTMTERIAYIGSPIPFSSEEEGDLFITGSICHECLKERRPSAYESARRFREAEAVLASSTI